MIKAKLLITALCITALLVLLSCKPPLNPNPEKDEPVKPSSKVIDFRNKDSSGKVWAGRSVSRAADDTGLEQKFEEVQEITTLGGLTEEDIAKIITFEDSENGLKVNYKTPESMKGSYSPFFNMVLVDSNGHWSTQMNNQWKKICAGEDGIIYDEFSFEYPLVVADKKTSFWFQAGYQDPSTKAIKAEFQWQVSVTPKHGNGMVDPLPKDFDPFKGDHVSYKDGRISFIDVIPPVGETVVKSAYVYVVKDKNKPWEFRPYGAINDYNIDYGQKTDFYIGDMVKTTDEDINFSEWPYFIVFMKYYYTVKGWDDVRFSTPVVYSQCYENDGFFGKPLNERAVSKTKVTDGEDGIKVTFGGDGFYDGLFESAETVSYLGKEIKPAVFVSGLEAYVFDSTSGNYSLIEKTSLKDFYFKGHCFTDDGKLAFKAGDNSVKIGKSGKSEIVIPFIIKNAKDVELKMDGHILKWVTKPEIEGDASGKIGINFFPDTSYQWIGNIQMPYADMKDIDLTEVDFQNISSPFTEFRKNGSFVISVNYDGNEFAIKNQEINYAAPEPKVSFNLKDFDSDTDGKLILTEGGAEYNSWRYFNFSTPESFKTLKKGDFVKFDYCFTSENDTNLTIKLYTIQADWVQVSSALTFWNEQGNAVKAGKEYSGTCELIMKEDLSSDDVIVFHVSGSYNTEGTTIVLDLQ